jgi:hypothetical protein
VQELIFEETYMVTLCFVVFYCLSMNKRKKTKKIFKKLSFIHPWFQLQLGFQFRKTGEINCIMQASSEKLGWLF